MITATTVTLALLGAAALVAAARFVWQRTRRPPSPLQQLGRDAQEALASLRAGGDLKDVVMRCYLEMVRTLNRERGIERAKDVTPREFAAQLEEAGLPGEHVRQLTFLFESVRYGSNAPGESEERQAVTCLEAIVAACGEPE